MRAVRAKLGRPLAVFALLGLALGGRAGATTTGPTPSRPFTAPNPAANLPLGSLASTTCGKAPSGAGCLNEVLSYLDGARARLGLPAYRLPGDFPTLSVAAQLLTLADLDRAAYGEAPIEGLSSTLDHEATLSVTRGTAPTKPATIHGVAPVGFGVVESTGSLPNALAAYYVWMFDDGVGGPNGACTAPAAARCWAHRQTILADAGRAVLSMGAADAHAKSGSLQVTFVLTSSSSAPVPYVLSWRDLEARGAGSHRYALGKLPLLPVAPSGLVARGGPGEVTLTWHQPRSRAPIEGYALGYAVTGSRTSTVLELIAHPTSYVVTGLTPGAGYVFSLAAAAADGSSNVVTATASAQ